MKKLPFETVENIKKQGAVQEIGKSIDVCMWNMKRSCEDAMVNRFKNFDSCMKEVTEWQEQAIKLHKEWKELTK